MKKALFLAAMCGCVWMCGCDLSEPVKTYPCSESGEPIAGYIIEDLTQATIPPGMEEYFAQGYCPKDYLDRDFSSCVSYNGNGFTKACSSCNQGEILCDRICMDGLYNDDNCGRCGNKCDASEQCEKGKCMPKCVSVCKDRTTLTECNNLFQKTERTCVYGCNMEENKCREDFCTIECGEDSTLIICTEDANPLTETCRYGCNAEKKECNKCEDSCSEDGTLVKCNKDDLYAEAEVTSCANGCDSDAMACNECRTQCKDANTLLLCDASDSLAAPQEFECPNGCDEQANACVQCTTQCQGENTLLLCDNNDPSAAPDSIFCPLGCDEQTLACIGCNTQCKDSKTLLQCDNENPTASPQEVTCPISCDDGKRKCTECKTKCDEKNAFTLQKCSDDIYAPPTKETCPYGCQDGACIELDSDGDGVIDTNDPCPYNGSISSGSHTSAECDEKLYDSSNDIFHVYCAQNLVYLNDNNDTLNGKFGIISIDNDINLGLLETTGSGDSCAVTKDLDSITITGVVVKGNKHRITATKQGSSCSVKNPLFNVINSATVKDLTVELDVSGGRAVLANTIDYSGVSILENVVVSGSVTNNDATQYVGGMIGYVSGTTRENDYVTEIRHQFVNSYAKDITVNAPNANWVGGMVGYADSIEYKQTSDSDYSHIVSVKGKENVGGLFGYARHFRVDASDDSIKQMAAIIDKVDGTNNVGGFAGEFYGTTFTKLTMKIGSIHSKNGSAGGFVGYLDPPKYYSTSFSNIAAVIDSIESEGSEVGGFVGHDADGSKALENVYLKIGSIKITGSKAAVFFGATSQSGSMIFLTNVFGEAASITAKDHVSGIVADDSNTERIEGTNTAVRANLNFSNSSSTKYSGISNAPMESYNISFNTFVSVVTVHNTTSNKYLLDRALFAEDVNGTDNPGFSYSFWYNLGDKDNSKPYASFTPPPSYDHFLESFDKAGANEVLNAVKSKNSTWDSTSFSTFNSSGSTVTANFPRFIDPTLKSSLAKLGVTD